MWAKTSFSQPVDRIESSEQGVARVITALITVKIGPAQPSAGLGGAKASGGYGAVSAFAVPMPAERIDPEREPEKVGILSDVADAWARRQ
jgi:hypothetical protein